jgi:hypothetical protein
MEMHVAVCHSQIGELKLSRTVIRHKSSLAQLNICACDSAGGLIPAQINPAFDLLV